MKALTHSPEFAKRQAALEDYDLRDEPDEFPLHLEDDMGDHIIDDDNPDDDGHQTSLVQTLTAMGVMRYDATCAVARMTANTGLTQATFNEVYGRGG